MSEVGVIVHSIHDQLVLHEGLLTEPYLDSEGFWTIAVGYNLDARKLDPLHAVLKRPLILDPTEAEPWRGLKLTREECLKMLNADVIRYEKATRVAYSHYENLDSVRRKVILDMAYNMGYKALGFKETAKWVQLRNWSNASREMYKSKWSRQVGDGPGGKWDRCDRLARMLLTGIDYTK